MSVMQRRAILKCTCCTTACVQVSGLLTYSTGITAAAFGITDTSGDGLIRWWPDSTYSSQYRCYRMLVYEGISVASNVIGTIGSPTYVVATNAGMERKATGGGPFNATGPDSGAELNTAPYWYAVCGAGGRALSTIAVEPTTANLNTFWAATPIADGTYTILVQTLTRRRYIQPPSGPTAIPAADAQYQIKRMYLIA